MACVVSGGFVTHSTLTHSLALTLTSLLNPLELSLLNSLSLSLELSLLNSVWVGGCVWRFPFCFFCFLCPSLCLFRLWWCCCRCCFCRGGGGGGGVVVVGGGGGGGGGGVGGGGGGGGVGGGGDLFLQKKPLLSCTLSGDYSCNTVFRSLCSLLLSVDPRPSSSLLSSSCSLAQR